MVLQNGVKTVFGYSGGANLPVLDTFHDSPIQFIMNRSEQCCGHVRTSLHSGERADIFDLCSLPKVTQSPQEEQA